MVLFFFQICSYFPFASHIYVFFVVKSKVLCIMVLKCTSLCATGKVPVLRE